MVGGPGLPGSAVEEQQQQQLQETVGCQLWGLTEILDSHLPNDIHADLPLKFLPVDVGHEKYYCSTNVC